MNKINRSLIQIHELEEELVREIETTQIATALNTIVNTKVRGRREEKSIFPFQFIHYIDAASLALMMPIIRRAFDDRYTVSWVR